MSPVLELSYTQGYPEEVRSPGPDLIAGILSYWVRFYLSSSASALNVDVPGGTRF